MPRPSKSSPRKSAKKSGPPAHIRRKESGDKHRGPKPGHLPEVLVLEILEIDDDGEALAAPVVWDSRRAPPHITFTATRIKPAPAVGARVLARLEPDGKNRFRAAIIKTLPAETPQPILGVYQFAGANGIIEPINRREKDVWFVPAEHANGAQPGELVSAETLPHDRLYGGRQARVLERLGALTSARAASLIAIHANNLPTVFSRAALEEAEAAPDPTPEPGRADLRDIPLITIDGEDARDFDDAVFARPEGSGFHLIVAIADVSHYVAPDSALDADAFQRGNSVYFPDRVVPMLPERLSNGLCSLKPDEDRYCLAAHIRIDARGHITSYRIERALMRSSARMTYEQVQKIADSGREHPTVTPLYAAYEALKLERDSRGALDLALPEYKIVLDASGNVRDISPKERLESHRLIEAFMIAANVASADFLLTHKAQGVYRVHEPPDALKLADLSVLLKHMGYHIPHGNISAEQLNRTLRKAEGTEEELIVHQSVLRAQMQAYYAPQCLGHFGLALQKYCHFTSPIRRYADLMVHREIVRVLSHEKHEPARAELKKIAAACQHISDTERAAMLAERDAMDRYRASFMADKVGETLRGVITGITEAGLFITLPEFGVTGFAPMRTLGNDFFHYDKKHAELTGQRSRKTYALGESLMTRVEAANGLTGSLLFSPEGVPSSPRLTRGPNKSKKAHSSKRSHERDRSKNKHKRRNGKKH